MVYGLRAGLWAQGVQFIGLRVCCLGFRVCRAMLRAMGVAEARAYIVGAQGGGVILRMTRWGFRFSGLALLQTSTCLKFRAHTLKVSSGFWAS